MQYQGTTRRFRGACISVIRTEALRLAETLPAASLAQAYRVLEPVELNPYVAGAEAVQPGADSSGEELDSVMIYPATPTLSVAVKLVIDSVNPLELEGTVKAETVGEMVSVGGGAVV